VLTVDTIPLQTFPIANLRLQIARCRNANQKSAIGNWQSEMLLGFFMISVFAATATELAELKPIRRGLFILGRYVIAALACTTLKNNIIAWHNSILIFVLVGFWSSVFGLRSLAFGLWAFFFEISNFRSQIISNLRTKGLRPKS
jgi:membrane glycosyltransferase